MVVIAGVSRSHMSGVADKREVGFELGLAIRPRKAGSDGEPVSSSPSMQERDVARQAAGVA